LSCIYEVQNKIGKTIISGVVLHGCDTWSLTLNARDRMDQRVFF